MRTVDHDADELVGEDRFEGLPERVQVALGVLAGAAKEGLLALSVGVGLGALAELMDEEVEEVVGSKGRHDRERAAVRHGREAGEVTLGGRRVGVDRPRAADGSGEVALHTYRHFADRDPLTAVVLEQMLAGVSTRRFSRTREPVGETVVAAERSTSKSAVSREFVGRTAEHLLALMGRRLDDVRLAALMLDGIELKGRCCVVALGSAARASRSRLGCGTARRRTRRSPGTCGQTSSTAAWTSSRASWPSSTAARRCGRRSARCSARCRSSAAFATRNATCSTTCPSVTGRRSSAACGRPGS